MPMAAASQAELPDGEAGTSEEKSDREMADAEMRQLSDQELRDKAQRTQASFDSGIAARLPDGGRKFRLMLDAMLRELTRRQALCGGTREPGADKCERIVRSRCAESSDTMKASHRHRKDQVGRRPGPGLPSDPNNVKLSKADFQSSFGMDGKTSTYLVWK